MFTFDALVNLYKLIIKILVKLGWIKDPNNGTEEPDEPETTTAG